MYGCLVAETEWDVQQQLYDYTTSVKYEFYTTNRPS
jgi:hypothetical protein